MTKLFSIFLDRLPERTRGIVAVCLFGLDAGLIAVAFHYAIELVYHATLVPLSHQSFWVFAWGSLAVMLGTALVAGWLMNSFCADASGSGIPQLKLAFWKDFGFIPFRAVWVKFIAGALSIGGGSSLGREGPSVHMAGGIASNLAGWLGEPKQRRRLGAAAGAAGGLAAAFNTPLAAVTFVLEEILGDLNSRLLGSVLLAGVIGALVTHGLIGRHPAFAVGAIAAPSWACYLLVPLLAALAAIIGALFQRMTLRLRLKVKGWSRIRPMWRPAVGVLVAWLIAVTVFHRTGRLGVFSLGYDDLSDALVGKVAWEVAGLLLAAKLLATVACYGTGGCGGIFSPTLFFGGMAGIFLGGVTGDLLALSPADQMTLAIVGMSACLGAAVRAPVTSILIVFEMTHEFALVPALMLGAIVSQAIARRITRTNFYEEILQQDGHVLERVIPPRDLQSWQQLPASAIGNFHPVTVTDTTDAALQSLLKSHPYERFPAVLDGALAGVVTRLEIKAALSEKRALNLEKPVTVRTDRSIRDLQLLLVEAPTNLVVLTDNTGQRVLGIVTLHDLLRAQLNFQGPGT